MTKKIYVLAEKENWITDQLEKEWKDNNKGLYTNNILEADIIWILSDYIASRIPLHYYENKVVYTTIHHIVPWKITHEKIKHFEFLNKISTFFVTNQIHCQKELSNYVTKPIKVIPLWHNENVWKCLRDSSNYNLAELMNKYKIPDNHYVIGSFQRDTEGAGIPQGIYKPKLEKGPDLLVKCLLALRKKKKVNVFVVLTGYRRQYIISELIKYDIPYVYLEMCDSNILNELYNCLDLYIIGSRVEGGPRSINECGLIKVPLITTDVGIARLMCHPKSIFDMNNIEESVINAEPNVEHLYDESQKYTIKNYMKRFTKDMFGDLD
jgi:glycosyltransferase involved in cell wall biosynthesis